MFRLPIGDDAELRLLEERHAEELFALVEGNRTYLSQWLPRTTETAEEERASIRTDLEKFAAGQRLSAGIWHHGKMAGGIALNEIDRTNRLAAIGYWVSEELQGRGLVTRACCALVCYAFNELKLNRVEILVAPGNTRSHAIPQRLGFTQEGTLRQISWHDDRFMDLVIYSMLADEWPAQQQSQGDPSN